MVTNTGTTAETASIKENGECAKVQQTDNTVNDDVGNLKQSADEAARTPQTGKSSGLQQNDPTNTMSTTASESTEHTEQLPAANGLPGNPVYDTSRSYGNGVPTNSAPVNGPPQPGQGPHYSNYGGYNHGQGPYMPKKGARPMHGGPNYPPMPRYPNPSATPTLNQLLTTPSRYPNSNHSSASAEYSQNQPQQNWQARPQQYPGGPPSHPPRPDVSGYPPQQPGYPPQQPGYPPNAPQMRYPPQSAAGVPYNQQYDPYMPPPVSSGYPPSSNPSRHPGYQQQGYPGYMQQPQQPPQQHPNYYSQRLPQSHNYPPSSYGPSTNPLPNPGDSKNFGAQVKKKSEVKEQMQNHGAPQLAAEPPPHPHGVEQHMMSPNRRTPQPMPSSHPGSVQSPMAASQSPHIHHSHPAVAQLRGPSPTPSSPSSTGQPRVNPLSPPSVRPGTPHQAGTMRPPSDAQEPTGQSPMQGPGYGHYRSYPPYPQGPGPQQAPHPPQHGNQGQPAYPQQHMMSPQQPQMYPSNQAYPTTPQHHGGPMMRPSGPPSGGKPAAHQAMVTPSYSQNQPSPGYQQPGNQVPYYDNMAPQQHMMQQGYNTPSPAPSERRPSRQGSHPSAALPPPPEGQGRQGAAAAAAAAMAAAAHTAQPGTTPNTPKTGTPAYYPPQQQPPQMRRPHPNFHNVQQGGEMYPSNMGYPRMPHPGTPGVNHQQRMMGPRPMDSPSGEQGVPDRMTPSYPAGYPQSGPPPQGHYPGYPGHYPHPQNHPNQPRPPMHSQGYAATPPSGYGGYEGQQQTTDDAPKPKSTARSASQKLNALFEPADEPGRREFIESVFKYWDDKDLPLKNAPLMGRKTLDLFRLYQLVKERGFWQKVTESKQWADISSQMGLGSTSTSGFTLKKQYCKYLYGYECRMERGEEEPQEAMARVIEANRKKKLQAEQQAQKDEPAKTPTPTSQAPPVGHPPPPQHAPVSTGQPHYPSQPGYPPGQYPPPHQHVGMQYVGPQGYMQQPPTSEAPHPGAYPPHPMQRGMPPRKMSMPGYPPPGHPGNSYPPAPQGPAPAPFPPSSQQAPIEKAPSHGSQTPQSSTPAPSVDETEPSKEMGNSQTPTPSIKPPVPSDSSLAAANPFNEPSKQAGNTLSQPPPGTFGYPPVPPHPRTSMPPVDPYQRGGYPPRPGALQSQPAYSSTSQYLRPQSHHSMAPGTPHQAQSPRNTPAYPQPLPGHPLPTRSSYPGQPPYSGQHGNYHGGQHFPGMKRPSADIYGPPSKYNRPDMGSPYPHHPQYPKSSEHLGIRLPNYVSPGSQPPRGISPHPHAHYDPRHPFGRRPTAVPGMSQRVSSPIPYRKIHRSMYPPGCVEATVPRIGKMTKKSAKDVGSVEAWRVVMALKSGLLAESTWALNALTIFLYDHNTVAQLKLSQLPGLLDALVEHYRQCLSEFFTLNGESEALGVAAHAYAIDQIPDEGTAPVEIDTDSTNTTKLKLRGRKKKNCILLSKYSGKFTTVPVKVEQKSDPFVVDRSDRWDTSAKVDLHDDMSHIVLNLSRLSSQKHVKSTMERKCRKVGDESLVVVEATLEDVLSIPCSVLFPEEYDIHGSPPSEEEVHVKLEKGTKEKVEDVKIVKVNSSTVDLKPTEEDLKTEVVTSQNGDVSSADRSSTEVPKEDSEKQNDSCPSPTDDVTDKLNDVTNKGDDVSVKKSKIGSEEKDSKKTEAVVVKEETEEEKAEDHAMCNGVQSDESSADDKSSKDEETAMDVDSTKAEAASTVKVEQETDDNPSKPADPENQESETQKMEVGLPLSSRVTFRVEKVLEERNVILLEDEALASDGSTSDLFSGTVIVTKECNKLEDLSNRIQCISNVICGLSFIPTNPRSLCQHRSLMRAVSGLLLLRHKHRTRPRRVSPDEQHNCDALVKNEEDTKSPINGMDTATKQSRASELFAPESSVSKRKHRPLLSATVFDSEDEDCMKAYSDPWWYDCIHRLREDSLVILSNVAPVLDLSKLPDDHTALAVIEACLHWTVCPSSDANDTFSGKVRPHHVSPQRLSLEILTKLTIKEHNIDLILATRPFSRIEKLFNFLVGLLCDRKEQTMREFSVVLLCNLSSGDATAARAIALQKGAVSGLISFLEEAEDHGINHRRMLPSAPIDCHTTPFMIYKCAKTLLALAHVQENKSAFIKYQLRLLSLSMSQFLAPDVTSTITSVLFEVSRCAT